ncbi:polysaccharide pyruvyl transferase family protein [Psychrobacter immobilis]|uniref:polysaccharide pyruvyl transferase family protein n=1 Tax=Psychrobacter immobilis TaxID=498 RepID=UPI00191B6215|nr:polysaccharide pyruvyl transferase family protein [Psychrobacter immobilis]
MYKKLFKSELLFTGYYGQLNTGDDAFIEVASWGAEKYWHKTNNIFLAKQERLPLTKKDIKGYPLSIPKTYSLQSRLLLSSTNYLISAGGSTIHSELAANNIKRLAVESKKKGSKIKIGGIGVSVGPFKTLVDEKATIEYLKNIDFLTVRDQESFDFVSSLGLPYETVNAFDLAALLPEIYGINKPQTNISTKKVIGISVCPYESITNTTKIGNEHKRNKKMVELLKILDKEENVHFKFFVINGNARVGDQKLTKETIEKVSPHSFEIIPYTQNTRLVWDEIATCDFLISTRLHAAIFACFSNTPFILNEYHRKCSDFLDNISYDVKYRIFDSEYEPREKAKSIIEILNDKSIYDSPKKTDEMKKRSELNFTGIGI